MSERIGTCEVALLGRRLSVEMSYPRLDGHVNEIEVGLCDVRAADSILIAYDFDRDGYSIKQASRFEWEADEVCDPEWQEVAFIQAWAGKAPR